MPTSLALDPGHVLRSAPEPQRAGRPLIVLMHRWSYDERHLSAFAHLFPGEMVVASVRAVRRGGRLRLVPELGQPDREPAAQDAVHRQDSLGEP